MRPAQHRIFRSSLRPVLAALAFLLAWGLAAPVAFAESGDQSGVLADFPVPNGYYFSQAAGGDPARGYTITNDGGIAFFDAFLRLGGVDAVGYPSTGRFTWMGFTDQATQKLILQWNPAAGRTDIVNTFDVMEQLGLDPQLLARRQTPPVFDNSADKSLSWPRVVARHQDELNWDAAIKARYFADPDPIAHFGLPQSYGDEGNVLVVRCQRAVFQQWKATCRGPKPARSPSPTAATSPRSSASCRPAPPRRSRRRRSSSPPSASPCR